MELNNTFKLTNENGDQITYVGLSVVENPESGQRYLIYTEAENAKEETGKQIEETLKPLLENPPEDIPRLKKQIKHCKNPLEEKALRKRLNEATRNSRRRNNSSSQNAEIVTDFSVFLFYNISQAFLSSQIPARADNRTQFVQGEISHLRLLIPAPHPAPS